MTHTTLEIPTLETPRLILRAPQLEDFEAWAAFSADEEATKFVGGVTDVHGAWRSMSGAIGGWSLRGFGVWSMVEKRSGRWIGRVGPFMPWDWPGTEVGYSLAREAWGAGYATEGAQAAVDFAFDHLGWTEVIHTIREGNVGSQAVATRLGAHLVGDVELPSPFGVCQKWVQTRAHWAERRNSRPPSIVGPPLTRRRLADLAPSPPVMVLGL